MRVNDVSRILHRALTGQDRSFCARAWEHRNTSRFWRAWVFVFGIQHCAESFDRYR